MHRSVAWIALGGLSAACAAGAFQPEPTTSVQATDAGDGPQQIAGIVLDEETEAFAHGALVVLQCTCLQGVRQMQTNANGVFRFKDLPPGNYTVQVLYGNNEVVRVVDLQNQNVRMRFRLSSSATPHVVT